MLFQQGKKLPKGLDDGVKKPKAKKQKSRDGEVSREKDEGSKVNVEQITTGVPTIKPGERIAEFNARVDAALPVSGLINKTGKRGKDPLGLKVGRTYKEKKMHRMYAEWREQDAKIKEKREEARELDEMEEEGEDGQVVWKETGSTSQSKTKKSKKGRKRKVIGEVDDGEEDPWAKIKRDRGEGKVALNDVVQAPPTFKNTPKEKFRVRGARVEVENVPKASGSLRRREELGEVRRSVVEGYRQMMKDNKIKAQEEVF
jgi:hypothetical protein